MILLAFFFILREGCNRISNGGDATLDQPDWIWRNGLNKEASDPDCAKLLYPNTALPFFITLRFDPANAPVNVVARMETHY